MAQHGVIKFLILGFGEDAVQRGVIIFNGLHRGTNGLRAVFAIGQPSEVIELGYGPQKSEPFCEKSAGSIHAPCRRVWGSRLNRLSDGQIPAVGMTQKDQAHHRQEILVAGVIGIGAQRVSRFHRRFSIASMF